MASIEALPVGTGQPDQPEPDQHYTPPQQKRSRESLERLLDAAEDQIRAEGLEGLTVASVVNRAGLSVGAFYSRFPDKDALLHSLQRRFHERREPLVCAKVTAQPESPETLQEVVERTIDCLLTHVTGEHALSRAFMAGSVSDPILRRRGEQVNRARREALVAALLPHREEIGHPDPVFAVGIAYGMYAAVIRGALMFGLEHELHYGVTNQVLFTELKKALVFYLRGSIANNIGK